MCIIQSDDCSSLQEPPSAPVPNHSSFPSDAQAAQNQYDHNLNILRHNKDFLQPASQVRVSFGNVAASILKMKAVACGTLSEDDAALLATLQQQSLAANQATPQ